MTYDAPSSSSDGMMPVLDVKVWMDEDFKVKFKFYEKEMASKVTVLKDSALTWTSKKVILAGEVARRMFNTSPDLVAEGEAEEDVDKFMYKLMKSGYTVRERNIIEDEGKRRYENVLAKSLRGERPLYRSSTENKLQRNVNRKLKEKKWWGVKHDSVMFVQATPGETLKKRIQAVCDQSELKVKVIEKGGRSMKQILQRSDVAMGGGCGRTDCVVCKSDDRGLCSKEGVGYMVWCPTCEEDGQPARMHGETGRCARVRIAEHFDAMDQGRSSNLREHCDDVHDGERVEFACKVTRVFMDPLTRQLDEDEDTVRDRSVIE